MPEKRVSTVFDIFSDDPFSLNSSLRLQRNPFMLPFLPPLFGMIIFLPCFGFSGEYIINTRTHSPSIKPTTKAQQYVMQSQQESRGARR